MKQVITKEELEQLKTKTKAKSSPKAMPSQSNLSPQVATAPLSSNELVDWSEEKMDFIFGKCWKEMFDYVKENDLELNNIVAITGKDTRKTTVFTMFMWWLMNRFDKLNAFVLRDTILKSQSQMRMQLRKSATISENEYGISGLLDNIQESTDGVYLVRDKFSKQNQKVEMLSFDSIIELGGFTTNNGYPAIFIYDELQNPNSINKEMITKQQFLANYKFISSKNRATEIATGYKIPKWIPRNIFLSNRYIGKYPLNEFAETFLPFYDVEKEDGSITEGVRTWMLKDPMENNFICKYVSQDEADNEGWTELGKTMIVYASKLSNHILRLDKEWEEEQRKLIARGNSEDLAVIIGDLFEGYISARNTYFYTRKEKVDENKFIESYASGIKNVFLCLDLDFSRQIVLNAKYYYENGNEFKVFRDKFDTIKCNGVSKDGAKTEMYLRQTYEAIVMYCVRIKKLMPHIKEVRIIMDDKKAQWVGRFNVGEYANNFWKAQKVDFDQIWKITQRPIDIDFLQDNGVVVDISHPSIDRFHRYIENSFAEPKSSGDNKIIYKRIEKANDETIDFINVDEYGLYNAITKANIMVYNSKEGK